MIKMCLDEDLSGFNLFGVLCSSLFVLPLCFQSFGSPFLQFSRTAPANLFFKTFRIPIILIHDFLMMSLISHIDFLVLFRFSSRYFITVCFHFCCHRSDILSSAAFILLAKLSTVFFSSTISFCLILESLEFFPKFFIVSKDFHDDFFFFFLVFLLW